MPASAPAIPRQMLPPPTTTATSTPASRTSTISPAMYWVKAPSMPEPVSPAKASPESLSRRRRYTVIGRPSPTTAAGGRGTDGAPGSPADEQLGVADDLGPAARHHLGDRLL